MTASSHATKIALYWGAVGSALIAGAIGWLFLSLEFDVRSWEWWTWLAEYFLATGTLPTPVLMAAGGLVVGIVAGAVLCPFKYESETYGSAAWARKADLRAMRPSVTARRGIVLGRFGGVLGFGGRLLMSDAPLSALVVAPAGTGKTAGVIVPSILRSDDASLIVNDPKGELYDLTAGYRATLGPVLRIEWTAGRHRSICWNPMDLSNLPPDGAERGDVVDRLVTLLVEGNEANFFVSAPRAGLSAWLLYQLYVCEAEGRTPSLAIALHALAALGQSEEAQEAAADGLHDVAGFDLELSAERAEAEGWPRRIATGLRQLASYDFKTRANVVGTINASMRLFLNDNVAETTSESDFSLDELRGAKGKPVTLYVVVPAFDQESFGKITALLIETATRHLTMRQPGRGELPVRFILDEVGFLPPMKAVSMGPAITRGYDVSFLFACQDYAQIRDKWGAGGLDSIVTNTAYKVVLTQNNAETANRISSMIGQQTRRREQASRSRTAWAKFGSESETESLEGVPLVRPEEILSLEFGHQIVLVQNHMKRPISCRSSYYLSDRACRRRAKLAAPVVEQRRR